MVQPEELVQVKASVGTMAARKSLDDSTGFWLAVGALVVALSAIPFYVGVSQVATGRSVWTDGWVRLAVGLEVLGALALLWALVLFVAHSRSTQTDASTGGVSFTAPAGETVRFEMNIPDTQLAQTPSSPLSSPADLTGYMISDKNFRVTDLPLTNGVVVNMLFERCHLHGPAVVAVQSSLYDDCTFDYNDNIESILWLAPSSPVIVGAIAFLNCRFKHCRFTDIGFAGRPDSLQKMRESV